MRGWYVNDDVLITGRTDEEHLRNFEAVKKKSAAFFKPSVGYLVDPEGLHTITEKVDAILNAPHLYSCPWVWLTIMDVSSQTLLLLPTL